MPRHMRVGTKSPVHIYVKDEKHTREAFIHAMVYIRSYIELYKYNPSDPPHTFVPYLGSSFSKRNERLLKYNVHVLAFGKANSIRMNDNSKVRALYIRR